MRLPILLGLCLLAGCAGMNAAADPVPPAAPVVTGFVTDVTAFEAFIATRPTPEQFRARYPDVLLVLPGQIATKEFRFNNSRYFAELDGEGRITGGRFS